MTTELKTAEINILDKKFGVACQPDEEDDLRNSAQLLDSKMREIRRVGKIVGIDRIAVMAALNIAHDLLKAQHELKQYTSGTEEQLLRINEKIEQVLSQP